jgi:hypothetical protein
MEFLNGTHRQNFASVQFLTTVEVEVFRRQRLGSKGERERPGGGGRERDRERLK